MPRRKEIEAELAGAKFFSCLDANSGFHQTPLDPWTSCICTFGTRFGRYRYKRLPFGISLAPEVFQKAMIQIFDGLPGVRVYIDDILIWSSTRQEHDARLRKVLEAAQREGLTLNPDKCRLGMKEITFLGDRISGDGVLPDPNVLKGVLQMPIPTNKEAVQRLLGLATYFGKYIPRLPQKTVALRSLVKGEAAFEWAATHQKEWQCLKETLAAAPVLAFYDPKLDTKISTDASQYGLGAALLQRHGTDWRPVACASRVLTDAETRYSQIERDARNCVWV